MADVNIFNNLGVPVCVFGNGQILFYMMALTFNIGNGIGRRTTLHVGAFCRWPAEHLFPGTRLHESESDFSFHHANYWNFQ